MKRLYLAIGFLAIAISLCIFEQYTVSNAYKQTTAYIDSAITAVKKDDYESAEKSCTQLSEYWNKKYPYMTSMIDHGPLDDATVIINSLDELAKNESDELETELITAKNQVKIIYDNQRVTLGNVL